MKALKKSALLWPFIARRFRELRLLVGSLLLCVAFLHSLAAETLSEADFRMLAKELAPKVNLFAAIWKLDPKAEFYGGTSRDFLYWILGKFRGLTKPEQIQAKIQELKKLEIIDITEIIGGESDVDIITDEHISVQPTSFRVRKFDPIPADHFAPNSKFWKNDREQGYNPTEKIHLSQNGVYSPADLGDGVLEILTGDLSLHPTPKSVFWKSHYAKDYHNHPLILALRFLRLRAAHWYQTEGSGLPDLDRLLNFNPATKQIIRDIFEAAKRDEKLGYVLQTEKGRRWLNAAVLKAFRSYTNPTAAYHLFNYFGYNELLALHPDTMVPINQFLFIPHRNPELIAANFGEYHKSKSPAEVFSKFPHSRVIHGTRGEVAFRSILFQNVMPSEDGNAGRGLYVVPADNEKFAETWGGSKDRIVSFEVAEGAKFIDTTQGLGGKLYTDWVDRNARKYKSEELMDEFAKAFGADIVRYSYSEAEEAYVIKNAEILINRQGLYRQLITVQQGADLARKVGTTEELESLLKTLQLNLFSGLETFHVLKSVKPEVLQSNLEFISKSKTLEPYQLLAISQFLPTDQKLALAKQFITSIIKKGGTTHFLFRAFDENNYSLEECSALIDYMIQNRLAPDAVVYYLFRSFHRGYSRERLKEWLLQVVKSSGGQEAMLELLRPAERKNPSPIRTSQLDPDQYAMMLILLKETMPLSSFRAALSSTGGGYRELSSVDWLLQKPSEPISMGLWWHSPEYAEWIDIMLKEKDPTPVIFDHMAAATEHNDPAERKARFTRWIKKALKKPSLKAGAIEIILRESLSGSEFVTAIANEAAAFDSPPDAARSIKLLLYLGKNAPNNLKAHKAVAAIAQKFQNHDRLSIDIFETMHKLFFVPDGLKSPHLQQAAELTLYTLMASSYFSHPINASSSPLLLSLLPLIFQCPYLTATMRKELAWTSKDSPFLLQYIKSLPNGDHILTQLKLPKPPKIRGLPTLVKKFVTGSLRLDACQTAISRLTGE